MLYDVLPPLVFFASLGGILLIVSRVVVRLRKEQFAHTVQVNMRQAEVASSVQPEELARIIGPSKKSVQVIKNRVALMGQTMRTGVAGVNQSVQRLAERRQKKASAAVEKPRRNWRESVSGVTTSVGGMLSRQATALTSRISSVRRRSQAGTGAIETEVAGPEPDHSVARPRPRLSMRETEVNPASETAQLSKRSGGFFGNKRQEGSKSAITRAQEALAEADVEKTENILVPYLVKHPKDTRAYMMLGETAMRRHNWAEAMEIFEQVVAINPRVQGSFAALGHAAYEAGKFTRAIEALQRAHDAEPQNEVILRQLLRIAKRMDNVPMQESLRDELRGLKSSEKQTAPNQPIPTR